MSRRAAAPGLLTREECAALGQHILGFVSAPEATVTIGCAVTATLAFARGDARLLSDDTRLAATVMPQFGARSSMLEFDLTDRTDDRTLRAMVAAAEDAARQHQTATGAARPVAGPAPEPAAPQLFFDALPPAMTPEARAAFFRAATDATEATGLVGAGDLRLECTAGATLTSGGYFHYSRETYGELSLTARTRDGQGSGWAWEGYEDWARVDVPGVIARAVDLAERSAKPVAVEPGRYTVILEPAAVAALLEPITPLSQYWSARGADHGYTVFSTEPHGTNKLGLRMLDERMGMRSDPWDPEMPWSPVTRPGEPPLTAVDWFTQGVLTNLSYDAAYAHQKGRAQLLAPDRLRLYATGSTQTLDAMIAATRRGIWVHRLSSITPMNARTLLLTGTTRDGTFLIENGKVTKAIRNFRFTESPFFVLNKVEAWGEPVRAARLVVAPRLKVRDFDFTSLTDAV